MGLTRLNQSTGGKPGMEPIHTALYPTGITRGRTSRVRNLWRGPTLEPASEIFCHDCGSFSAVCTLAQCGRPGGS